MTCVLASAEQTGFSDSGWFVILIGLGVFGAAAVLTVIPIVLARRRRSRRAEAITVAAVFWGLVAAASILHFWLAELRWSNEYLLLVKTGYYDPANTSGAPAWPWPLWGVLAAAYGVLVILALSRSRRPAPPPT